MEIVFAFVLVIGATATIFNLPPISKRSPFRVSSLEYINTQSTYQAMLLGVALLVLLVLSFVNRDNLRTFLALGNIAAPAEGVSWMGISEGESWRSLGASLAFFITFATSAFVYAQLRKSGISFRSLVPFLPWVLLFSFTNSFSEEAVYRLGVIVPLAGSLNTAYLLLFSAVAFGVSHFRGMPNGIVGVFMAGLLGWLLAKSVLETNGIFWAWCIHFLQDMVIFSAFVMQAASESLPSTVGVRCAGADRDSGES